MLGNSKYCLGTSFLYSLNNNRPNVCSILCVKKGIILSSSDKNCFILGFISVKKTKNRFYVGRQKNRIHAIFERVP